MLARARDDNFRPARPAEGLRTAITQVYFSMQDHLQNYLQALRLCTEEQVREVMAKA